MKKITIFQRGASDVVIADDSDVQMAEYCQELSKIFKTSNVVILNTSSSTYIGRPSQLTGVVVEDLNTEEQQQIEPDDKPTPEDDVKPEPQIQEDIITDIN